MPAALGPPPHAHTACAAPTVDAEAAARWQDPGTAVVARAERAARPEVCGSFAHEHRAALPDRLPCVPLGIAAPPGIAAKHRCALITDTHPCAPRDPQVTLSPSMDRANAMFDSIDVDKSGTIEPGELIMHFLSLGQEPDTVSSMFAVLDTNKDGSISREEFVDGFEKLQALDKLAAEQRREAAKRRAQGLDVDLRLDVVHGLEAQVHVESLCSALCCFAPLLGGELVECLQLLKAVDELLPRD